MKYWILTTEYPPLFGGGISTYCYEAARMHTEHGDEVTVFIPDDKVMNYQVRETEGVRIVTFNSNRSKLANYLGYIPRLSFEFAMILTELIQREGKPDFIEAQEYLAIAYYTLQFKKLLYQQFAGVPVVLVLHSPAFLYLYYNREGIYEFPNYWTGELEISCIRAADHVIAPSAYIVDEIRKHISLEGVPVTVLRNPYAFEKPAQAAPAFTRNKIVFFGKLSPQKGVFELFEYFKALWDAGEKYVLNIVGGTEKVYYPEMKTMGQLIEQRYAPYIQQGLVTFRGKIAPSEKARALSDAHVVLIPSLNDNLPYAAIESMGLGKVILASKQGGQAELITDKINGFIFDHEVPGDFARKLKEVLALPDHRILTIGETAAGGIRETLAYNNVYAAKKKLLTAIAGVNVRPSRSGNTIPTTSSNTTPATSGNTTPTASGDTIATTSGDTIATTSDNANFNGVDSVTENPKLAGIGAQARSNSAFPFTRPLAVPAKVLATETTCDLLSVVIPYYNMGAYIDDCVQSVLASSYKHIEVIIIDDGSSDEASREALARWQDEPRVTVITRSNVGLAHTRNYGASLAKGKFLAFLDADDKIGVAYYEKAIQVLSHYGNVSFVGSWVQFFGTKTDIWPTWNPEPPYILLHNSMNTSALVYKTAAFLDAGINDRKVDYGLEDYGSIISLLSAGYRGVVLPEALFHYRIRPDSMYRSLTRYKAMYSHQYLAQKHPGLYQMYATDIFSLMNANGPSFAYDNPSFGIRVTSTVTGNSGLINNLKMFVKRNPALKKILLQAKAVMKL